MRKKKKQVASQAELADRHALYERAVQYAPSEVEFVDDTFKKLKRRRARVLREDFCGTANVCCEWVRLRKTNRAIGVDIDPEVLAWGEQHNLSTLDKGQRRRLSLLRGDVLKIRTESPPDIISAMNFSYMLFTERSQLKRYFRKVFRNLDDNGVFFLDAYGGYDSYREITEEREIDDGAFTYIWEQESYNPIDGTLRCHIHFAFPDGSRLERAFSYPWRLWTLPEIRELLTECGFKKVTVYWQGWDEDGEPDGHFKPTTRADADAGWICYLSAEKS